MRLRGACLLLVLLAAGCAARPAPVGGGLYSASKQKFDVTLPSDDWLVTEDDERNAATFLLPGATWRIAVLSGEAGAHVPLDVLNRHLLAEFREKTITSSGEGRIGGVPAVYRVLEATLDERTVRVKAWTARLGESVYDVVFWAPSESYDGEIGHLAAFLSGMTILPASVGGEASE